MTEICVVYLSEDEPVVDKLVQLLRADWDVWWAHDNAYDDWEEAVRAKIRDAKALVPVLSGKFRGSRKSILKDEMRYAKELKKAICPFLIGDAEIPFGFGDETHTASPGWSGDPAAKGFIDLRKRLTEAVGKRDGRSQPNRPRTIAVQDKTLHLPSFVFSLSSHETQLKPAEGVVLLRELSPGPCLVSAYDAWRFHKNDKRFFDHICELKACDQVLILDSGNYEASRKSDHKTAENPDGWDKKHFREIAMRLAPDLAFSFDRYKEPTRELDVETSVARVVKEYRADERAMRSRNFALIPIIHLQRKPANQMGEFAAQVVTGVARELKPLMIAIPERELGDGLMQRVRTVRDIRRELNSLGQYCPIHLLGTGNPLTMIALAAAGADSFDGLEWCRTVAAFDTGLLFHFQQFDLFKVSKISRVQNELVRRLIQDDSVPYPVKVLSYNTDFFNDWTRTMGDMIHSGQTEGLLRMVPDIGREIFAELSK